jgi:UDP-2-acetamido-3-amino-2,3-dideoxy-glucuronate N-acetyltransferase
MPTAASGLFDQKDTALGHSIEVAMKNVFIHPTALVETDQIGEGTRIWAFAHVLGGASLGKNCNVGDHCFIEGGAWIGDKVTMKNGNMVWEGIRIEEGAFVGPHVFFTNDLYPRSQRIPQSRKRYAKKENWLLPTLIKKGASLGAGAMILAGVTVGEFSMVGASAVVTKDVPPYALVVGAPARVRGWVCECGLPLRFKQGRAICADCGLRYRARGSRIAVVDPTR